MVRLTDRPAMTIAVDLDVKQQNQPTNVQLSDSRPEGQCLVNNGFSHLGGYIYSIGLVKAVSESLQELVRASSSSMLVTLNYV